MTDVKLTGMQRAVLVLYYQHGLCQREIAAELKLTRWAVWCRLQRIAVRYAKAGVPLLGPGEGLTRVRAQSLSGVWTGREYLRTAGAA